MSTQLIKDAIIMCASGGEKGDLLIREGLIKATCNGETVDQTIEAEGKLIFPGLIDCHVHFREPGFPEKGDMQTESEAAVNGGVTTVCDMPNTVPPTVTASAFAEKVELASRISNCDIRFFFGVTQSDHLKELETLWENNELKKRCCGVKVFFDHSTGDQKAEMEVIEKTFELCAQLGIPVVAHCEDAELNTQAQAENIIKEIEAHSAVRPVESEAKVIEEAIGFVHTYGTHLHIAHLSTAEGVELVREAKADNLPVTCEVAPHHLFLSTDDYEQLGTLAKMNPPLRDKEHCKALWKGIADKTVDCISTDHAPHTLEEKRQGPPLEAPSGVPGVGTMLPLLLSVAGHKWPHPTSDDCSQGLTYADIVRLCFENPNKIFLLGKDGIKENAKVDLIIIDPEKEWKIKGSDLHYKCGWTPYEGWKVKGFVETIGA